MYKSFSLLFFCNLLWSQGFTIRTVAGSNAVGEQAPAQNAALASTEGIAIDHLGNVYLADAPDHRIRKIEPSGRISTLAGNGQPGFAGDGGPASEARLNSPYGLAIDLAGNLYIADLGNARVRRISAGGTISTVAGGGEGEVSLFGASMRATEAKLNAPRNVVVDAAGQLYIADFGGHRVYRLSTDGHMTQVAGTGVAGAAEDNVVALTAPLKSPTGLALDRAGSLYIADSGNAAIRRLQRGIMTKVTSTGGFNRELKFATITGLAIDGATGDLYVAEGRETPVRRVTPASEQFAFAYGARDLALDAHGVLWLADGPFVRKISSLGSEIVAGTGSFQFGGDGGLAVEARLRSPSGVATDRAGNIYLSDTANHRVRRIALDGRIETVAGTGEAGYGGDGGLAVTAKLRSPTALVVDAVGNLYIADTGNHAVRRVNPAGTIETWAGTGTAGAGSDQSAAKRVELNRPQGLTVDRLGNLIIADTENHRIGRVSVAGTFTLVAGRGTPGNTGDGAAARIATLTRPTDVEFDGRGILYIADSGNRRIRWVSAQGLMMGFPSEGLVEPVSLAWSGDGFYLADAGLQRVYLVSSNGARALVAGTGVAGFSGDDGPAAQAQLNRPVEMAVGAAGELLIADQENHRLRGVARLLSLTPGAVVPPAVSAVVSAATLRAAPAVPGGLMTLFGSGLGPASGVVGRVDVLGRWTTSVEGVEVRFDGVPAPLFYVSDNQINLQVPRMVTGRARVSVSVTVNGETRGTRTVEVAEAAPALFIGAGNQVAALNQDGGLNLPLNSAGRGSIVTVFATGSGQWEADLPDGAPALAPLPRPRLPVTLWIGGQAAELLYAGAAPGQVGLLQINARVPAQVLAGQVAVVLQVGDAASEVGPMMTLH
jgi:uncharacterized protein (TIGR03437 family)